MLIQKNSQENSLKVYFLSMVEYETHSLESLFQFGTNGSTWSSIKGVRCRKVLVGNFTTLTLSPRRANQSMHAG